jgi:hypothetical protein
MKKQKMINEKISPKVHNCTFGLIMVLLVSLSFVKMTKSREITKTYLNFSAPFFNSDADFFYSRPSTYN